MTANAIADARTIPVRGPVDDSIVGFVADTASADVAAAISDMRAAQPAWEALGARGRASWLRRYGKWLRAHQGELAALLQSETGKPRHEATVEILLALDVLGYCARNAAHFLADQHPRPHGVLTAAKKLTLTRRPYPVVGVICPWNFPLLIALADALPALAAGAAVAIKPSELTPLATKRAIEGWREIDGPNIVACLTGAGATGAALIDQV